MTDIDRRSLIRSVLGGAAVAAAAIPLVPRAIEAAPLALDKTLLETLEGLPDELQHEAAVVVVNPRRRRGRRRWVCWWRRGRRICGWRWV